MDDSVLVPISSTSQLWFPVCSFQFCRWCKQSFQMSAEMINPRLARSPSLLDAWRHSKWGGVEYWASVVRPSGLEGLLAHVGFLMSVATQGKWVSGYLTSVVRPSLLERRRTLQCSSHSIYTSVYSARWPFADVYRTQTFGLDFSEFEQMWSKFEWVWTNVGRLWVSLDVAHSNSLDFTHQTSFNFTRISPQNSEPGQGRWTTT